MKESYFEVLKKSQQTNNLQSVFKKTDEANMVGFFYRLYYNYHLLQEIDNIEIKYNLETDGLQIPMKTIVYQFLRTIEKPSFSINTMTLSDLETFKYKYPLYYEFIEAYTNVTKTYVTSDNINHFNYVLKKFMQYNTNAIQHMEGLFLNLFKVTKFDSRLNFDSFLEKSKGIVVYGYPRIFNNDASRHSSKLLIRKHITGTTIFKKSVRSIKQTIRINAMKEIIEIERKLFQAENIKQWFKNNQLKPAIGFNTTKKLLSLCS
jgi:hypothetical protein